MNLLKKYIFFIIVLICNLNCYAGSNVEHIFELAEYSTCNDVAEDLLKNPIISNSGRPTGKAGYFISKLNALTVSLFPYI